MNVLRPLRLALILISIFILLVPSLTAQDPFRSSGDRGNTEAQEDGQIEDGPAATYRGPVPEFFLNWSRNLQQAIAGYSRMVRAGGNLGVVLLSFLTAVLFGMIHVLGPGHGKLFTFSYVSTRNARVSQSLVLAAGINIVDSLSAAALVFGGYGLLSLSVGEIQGEVSRIIQIISYSLVIVLSGGHLLSHWLPGGHHHHGGTGGHHHHHDGPDDHHRHSEDHSPGHDRTASDGTPSDDPSVTGKPGRRQNPLWLALSIGIIPCPVSTVLLIFGVVNGLVFHSIILVAGVSLGGFISMAVLTVGLIRGREFIVRRFSGKVGAAAAEWVEAGGLVIIIVAAVLLLLSQIAG